MARKTYDAATIANALATVQAEGNFLRASKLLGISRSTLRAWASGQLPGPVASEPVAVFAARQTDAKQTLAKGYREVEGLYLGHLKNPEVVAKASAAQAAIVAGVMSDKATRAEGGPTSISEHRVARYVEPNALRKLADAVLVASANRPERVALPSNAGTPVGSSSGASVRRERSALDA
jgi:hypothetical protein